MEQKIQKCNITIPKDTKKKMVKADEQAKIAQGKKIDQLLLFNNFGIMISKAKKIMIS